MIRTTLSLPNGERLSRVILWCSAVLYLIGCFTAYLLGPILVHFDS